jgi:rhamnogalacturonan endolyase
MLRGSSGFYSYAIYEHLKDWPDFEIGETRITFKLRKDKYSCYIMSSFVCHIKLSIVYIH